MGQVERDAPQWSGSQTASVGFLAIFTGIIAFVLATLIEEGVGAVAILAIGVAAAAIATYSHVRVEITDHGVRARLGPLGWPTLYRPMDAIAGAEAVHVNPIRYGGWGHRFTFSATAIVIRGGEGLLLRMKKGRNFVITVKNPAEAATIINDLITTRS